MLNSIIALRALDYPKDHPLYRKALQDFSGFLSMTPRISASSRTLTVWIRRSTLSLWRSPASPPSIPHSNAPPNGWSTRSSGPLRLDDEQFHSEASGWAFEYNNVFYPDTDDTAMVLMRCGWFGLTSNPNYPKCSSARSPGS